MYKFYYNYRAFNVRYGRGGPSCKIISKPVGFSKYCGIELRVMIQTEETSYLLRNNKC